MPEFRQNLATKEWVIIAPERSKRPRDNNSAVQPEPLDRPKWRQDCPFCPGNEERTTVPVLVYPTDGPQWQVRVVTNLYAALNRDLEPTRTYHGRFLAAEGFGVADVVIEHPRHDLSPAQMSESEVATFLRAYRERYVTIDKDLRINLVSIFRNHGPRAGTSLEHPHSQIIATPIVPPHVRDTVEQAVRHFDKNGTCVYCDVLAEELKRGEGIIEESAHFVAFCPWASRSPFECRIYPRRHTASYMLTTDEELADLAAVLRRVLGRLYIALDNPDYNYLIRSAPSGDHDARYLHWYMVIIPRISTRAGFEIGTGIYINPVPPERAAEDLRAVRLA